MNIVTDGQVYETIMAVFSTACSEIGIDPSEDNIVEISPNKQFRFKVRISVYSKLVDYLRAKYIRFGVHRGQQFASMSIFQDHFVNSIYPFVSGDFEFTDQKEYVYSITFLAERIALMYATRPNITWDRMSRYILLRLKKELGYALQFNNMARQCKNFNLAFDEFVKWNDRVLKQAHECKEKHINTSMNVIEYYEATKMYNEAIQPVFELAGVDVEELTRCELEIRDNLIIGPGPFESPFNKKTAEEE